MMLISALLLSTALGAEPRGDGACTGGGVYPDPVDCNCFFHCGADNSRICCGPGTMFDPALNTCNHKALVDCSDRVSNLIVHDEVWPAGPFDCPSDGIFSDPDNCHCFYDCANGTPFHECCGAGTMFDEQLGICNYEDQVDCGSRPRPGSTRPPTPTSTATQPTTTTAHTDQPTTPAPTDQPTTPAPTDQTTTTARPTQPPSPGPNDLPKFVLGMYILLADDTEPGYHTNSSGWDPLLHPYQQEGSNVLFFTFINPATMDVPISFQKLAATRGKGTDGAVPASTRIIFAIGGYAYSINPNPWEWLTSRDKAEAMAERVAKWQDDFLIDGIDLDIEEGAGAQPAAGPNMVHFIRRLKALRPGLLVTQPTYGYPQVAAEIDIINASWNVGGTSNGLADSIGLMVYEGTQALQYVKNYAEGSSQWEGFPIQVDVPRPQILLGCKGSSSGGTIDTLAKESVSQDLLGIMVWFCSVRGGLVYGNGWDCSDSTGAMEGYVAAMEYFVQHTPSTPAPPSTPGPPSPTTTSSDITTTMATTTTSHGTPGPNGGFPKYVLGMYILLADDYEDGFGSDADWQPLLHPYQQAGANVLFFTFINPATMEVPLAFQKLAATRGTDAEGAVPGDTLVIFAIGGYAYSINPNPWEWLTSRQKAEAMADKVARWREDYGIQGIDLDIEEGAGSKPEAGPNMAHFIRRLKQLQPGWIVSQPTYGYPQIAAEIDVINASWNVGGTSNGLADSIGLMVYEGTQALQYVKNYAEGSSQWEGFPIQVDVPRPQILLGCKGSSSPAAVDTLARESVRQGLLGLMVWFCSVRNGLVYGSGWDCSDSQEAMDAYVAAMEYLNSNM